MKGIIYKIECNINGEVYYGSTQQTLHKRMMGHKASCKAWKTGTYHYMSSFDIIERGNYSYSLLETVECNDKKQLEERETHYINNNECINRNMPRRTKHEYHEANQNKIKERGKAYREANKDKIDERKKAYNEAHKEQKKAYNDEYREANKHKINEQKKVYYLKQKQLKEQTN